MNIYYNPATGALGTQSNRRKAAAYHPGTSTFLSLDITKDRVYHPALRRRTPVVDLLTDFLLPTLRQREWAIELYDETVPLDAGRYACWNLRVVGNDPIPAFALDAHQPRGALADTALDGTRYVILPTWYDTPGHRSDALFPLPATAYKSVHGGPDPRMFINAKNRADEIDFKFRESLKCSL